jgi:hypothetical protein
MRVLGASANDAVELRTAIQGEEVVRIEDTVYPDMVIGKAGTLDEEHYEVRVSIDYLTAPIIRNTLDFRNIKRNILNPRFLTTNGVEQINDGGEYSCQLTDELLYEEMSKREQRNRNKK